MFEARKLEWTKELSVGIATFDGHHMELVTMLNNLVDAVENGRGADEVVKLFGFLDKYVTMHFNAEEEMMRQCSYPGLKEHKYRHEIFKKTLAQLEEKHSVFGATDSLMELLKSQLCGWILTHIRVDDNKYSKFLREAKRLA